MRRHLIAVIGAADLTEGDRGYDQARELGRLLIDGGYRISCGGMGGVMEAACRGAHDSASHADGDTIGLLPGHDPATANRWVDVAIPTGIGLARNSIVANADAVVAVGGGAGTLSEMCYAWMNGRPLVALDAPGWSADLAGRPIDSRRDTRVHAARTPAEAIEVLANHL